MFVRLSSGCSQCIYHHVLFHNPASLSLRLRSWNWDVHLASRDDEDHHHQDVVTEWLVVAHIMDRLLFWLFLLAAIVKLVKLRFLLLLESLKY